MSIKFVKASFQYATCTLPPAFSNIPGSDLSVSLWGYVTDFTRYDQWSRFMDGKYDANNFVQFAIPFANRPQFSVHDAGTDRAIAADSALNANQWYHLMGVWTAATNSVQFFVDTTAQSGAGDLSTVSPGTAGILNFGRRSDADPSNTFFDGYIDDLRVYNRALPLDEIQAIFACKGTDGIVYGLQNRWLFNENQLGAVVTSITDIIGGYNGTPGNSPTYEESSLKFRRRIT